MKKIILLTIIIFFMACSDQPTKSNYENTQTETPSTNPTTPENQKELKGIIYGTQTTYLLYDDGKELFKDSKSIKISDYELCNGNKIYTLNEYGEVTGTYLLQHTPEAIIRYNGKIYYSINIMTGNVKLSETYIDGVLDKTINTNITSFKISRDNKLFYYDYYKSPKDYSGLNDNVLFVWDNGLWQGSHSINGIDLIGFSNWINNAYSWIEYDGIWYSPNGYSFDGVDAHENINCLYENNSDTNAHKDIIVFCKNIEGHYYFYYIETSTGWLMRFNIDFDTKEQVKRLYVGDGSNLVALDNLKTLHPTYKNNELFYCKDNFIYCLNIESLEISIVAGFYGYVHLL